MSDVGQIQVISMPRLNEAAPDFEAETTHGRRRLSDYHGKWLVLFSLFSDFTPVCTAELSAFAEAQGAFSRLNTELLGLSAATTADHHAWLWKIKQQSGVEVTFPLIEDPSLKIGKESFSNPYHFLTKEMISRCQVGTFLPRIRLL